MQVHLNPDLKAKLDQWTAETGRSADELVEDAMTGYFDELAQVREMLDSRYDDLKSGKVRPIDGADALARLREKSEARRANRRE
jgi:hypothetical protein